MVNIILGTSYSPDKVCMAAEKVGFDISEIETYQVPHHKIIEDLIIQIHPPAYFKDVEGIVTEIEFGDTNKGHSLESMEVLNKLYKEIPDLKYREAYFLENPSPIVELSEFLSSLELKH
ncbi:hypothetical protein ACFL0E_00835 [Nanoarchaeota archaeon]